MTQHTYEGLEATSYGTHSVVGLYQHSLGWAVFLAVDAQDEVALFVRLKRRRHDDVGARFEGVVSADLAQVDERRRARACGV